MATVPIVCAVHPSYLQVVEQLGKVLQKLQANPPPTRLVRLSNTANMYGPGPGTSLQYPPLSWVIHMPAFSRVCSPNILMLQQSRGMCLQACQICPSPRQAPDEPKAR